MAVTDAYDSLSKKFRPRWFRSKPGAVPGRADVSTGQRRYLFITYCRLFLETT